jgi:hypothetical protein
LEFILEGCPPVFFHRQYLLGALGVALAAARGIAAKQLAQVVKVLGVYQRNAGAGLVYGGY